MFRNFYFYFIKSNLYLGAVGLNGVAKIACNT